MNSLLYGYLRVSDETDDASVCQMEHGIRGFARAKGFCLAGYVYEYQSGCRPGFETLIEELQRSGARHVVVPSLGHLSGSSIISGHLLARLEIEARAKVHELDDA
ncbi:MAG TPA: recombinase family protein [Pseudonocardiaceae bacterium]|jgi:DNA invertase Pin-like site-specific DNA recombinase|nr:recombinase family protein [Pseudonocardiaceae bacterium]